MAHDLPLLERVWESGYGRCPSIRQKGRRVVMVIIHPSSRSKGALWEVAMVYALLI